MTERDVALTDYLLTLEAAVFAVLVWRSPGASDLRLPFALFFSATAFAALTGGTMHGFFADVASPLRVWLWRATLVALGVVALAAWAIVGRMLLPADAAGTLLLAAAMVTAVYMVVVIAVDDRFKIAIVNYVPPTVFMLLAFVVAYRQGRPSAITGIVGLVLTLVAAIVQQQQIALHRVYFNHNALYHAIQAAGLFLIFLSARGVI